MSFATRCPECRAKLRLDAEPDAGESIECPKCGSTFAPDADVRSDDAPPPKKVKKPKKEKKPVNPAGPKKRKVKKKKTNPVLLFSLLGIALAFVVVLTVFLVYYLGKAGKVEEMMCYIPGECNVVRGMNTGQVGKYPGFASEMDSVVTPSVKQAASDLSDAVGFDETNDMLEYVIVGKNKKGGRNTGAVYVFRAKKSFPKPNPLDGNNSMNPANANGTSYYMSNGKGLLEKAAVFQPNNKMIVVIPSGPMQQAMINSVAGGGVKNKASMFAGLAGDTGKKVSAGNNWILVRPDGALKDYAKDMGNSVKAAFPTFATACEKTTCLGWWTTYGGKGISFGGGIECADSTACYELQKSMNDGELGKQDDAEIPNDMKKAVQSATSKEFREFLAWLKFRRYGNSAYFTAKMSSENGKRYSQQILGAGVATWNDDTGEGGGGFGPRGPRGGGPGGGLGGP